MKISAIHCYAAIELGTRKKRFNYVSERDTEEFTYIAGVGVQLLREGIYTLVPFANIASLQLKENLVVEKVEEPKKVEAVEEKSKVGSRRFSIK